MVEICEVYCSEHKPPWQTEKCVTKNLNNIDILIGEGEELG
jgi:hypothetical protein